MLRDNGRLKVCVGSRHRFDLWAREELQMTGLQAMQAGIATWAGPLTNLRGRRRFMELIYLGDASTEDLVAVRSVVAKNNRIWGAFAHAK